MAGWLFADVSIALAFIFLAAVPFSSRSQKAQSPPEVQAVPPPSGSSPPSTPTTVGCAAKVTRYGAPENSDVPLIAFGPSSSAAGAVEGLRAFQVANGLEGIPPAFVEVFGVSPDQSTSYKLQLARRFAAEVLPSVIPGSTVVNTYFGGSRKTDGVDVLWFIAKCI